MAVWTRELHMTLKMTEYPAQAVETSVTQLPATTILFSTTLGLLTRTTPAQELRQHVAYVVLCRCHARSLHAIEVFWSIFS